MNENFITSLDQYIYYFTKSENTSSHRNLKTQEYFNNTNAKQQKAIKKELTMNQSENKILRQHIDQLELKINELLLIRKKFSYELKEYKSRDEENKKVF